MIDYIRLNHLIRQKTSAGYLTPAQGLAVRNKVAALARPGCPVRLRAELARQVGRELGEDVIK